MEQQVISQTQLPAALGMPWLQRPLREALEILHGHALLVCAQPGAGAFELSLAMAQGWLCQSEKEAMPCGRCASCHWVAHRTHPDLMCLVPEALQEVTGWQASAAGEVAGEEKASKAKPSQDIKVEAVRRAVAFAQTTSSHATAKVVVIHPAERMNTVAANALLKTLEEPPGSAVRFILSCTAPQALLPTLRSRCQVVSVGPPAHLEAVQWLHEQGVAQAEVLLAAAGGLPLQARDWAAEGLTAALWHNLPQWLLKGEHAGPLAAWPLPRWVESLQKLCHDAMCVLVNAPPRFFAAEVVPKTASLKALSAWSRELQALSRHSEHPWSQPLALTALWQRARQVLSTL